MSSGIRLSKALVVTKCSRWLSLADSLGSSFGTSGSSAARVRSRVRSELRRRRYPAEKLEASHERNEAVLLSLVKALEGAGASVDVIYARDLRRRHVRDVDAIFTCGGDGTMLATSRYIVSKTVPVIGVNSDPVLSAGELCSVSASKEGDSFSKMARVVEAIQSGRFATLYRSRIRTSIYKDDFHGDPCATHFEGVESPASFALNEVFVSERDPARPAILEMGGFTDDGDAIGPVILRSSGCIVATGTGSSAWISNAAMVHPRDVQAVTGNKDIAACARIAERIDRKWRMEASSDLVQYYIREPIIFTGSSKYMSQPRTPFSAHRGFASHITLSPLGFDAQVNVDGIHSMGADYGSRIKLQIDPEFSLRCLRFPGI